MTDVGLRVMDVSSARRLTERIRLNAVAVRDGVEKLQALLEEAKEGNVHVALGYPSWPAYIADVMGDEPLRLSRDDRREIVHYLTGEGMSTRAIGSALGVGNKTIARDLLERSRVSNDTRAAELHIPHDPCPDEAPTDVIDAEVVIGDELRPSTPAPRVGHRPTVTGLDGKTYAAPPPLDRRAAPLDPRRKPLTDAIFDAVYDLGKKAETVRRLIEDDRFPQNAEKVAAKHRNDLLRTRDLIDQVIALLPTEGDSQ